MFIEDYTTLMGYPMAVSCGLSPKAERIPLPYTADLLNHKCPLSRVTCLSFGLAQRPTARCRSLSFCRLSQHPIARCQRRPTKCIPNLANFQVPIVARNRPNEHWLLKSPNRLKYAKLRNYIDLTLNTLKFCNLVLAFKPANVLRTSETPILLPNIFIKRSVKHIQTPSIADRVWDVDGYSGYFFDAQCLVGAQKPVL